jgi:hypothetical protein
VENVIYADRMPHVSRRSFGLAAPSGVSGLTASQMVIESRGRQQLRRSRVTISESQSRGADPEERIRSAVELVNSLTYIRWDWYKSPRQQVHLGMISPGYLRKWRNFKALEHGGGVEKKYARTS